jgi:hypothetical protein
MKFKRPCIHMSFAFLAASGFGIVYGQVCPQDRYCSRSLDGYRYPFQQHSALNFDQVWRPPVMTGFQMRRDWFDSAANPFRWDVGPMTGVGSPQVLTNPYGTGDPFHSQRLQMTLPRR